jgi:hypothetical protein
VRPAFRQREVKSNLSRGRILEAGAWFVAVAAYVAVGSANIWPTLSFPRLHPSEPFASTDNYLEVATGLPHASSRFLQTMAPLARDKAVVLILPDNGLRSAFINQNVSYLSWPREVRWLCADAPDVKEQLFAMSPSTVAALIFWDTIPFPNLPAGIHIAADQVVIPVSYAATNR